MYRGIFIFILFVFFGDIVFGQNLYVNNYAQKEYGSEEYTTSPQNWNIEQDSLGRLYIANSSGVLLFDGLTWNMIPDTENYNLFSLVKNSKNVIYAGGREELGYFKSDTLGKVVFESLVPFMHSNGIEPEVIQIVKSLGEAVYFKNKNGIIQLKDDKATFFPLRSEKEGMIILNNTIIVQDDFGNILGLKNEKIDTLYSFGDELKSGIVALFELPGDQQILFTGNSGIYSIVNKRLEKWKTDLNTSTPLEIKEVINYPNLKLFGIATKNSGIIFLNYQGTLHRSLGTRQGLTSNTCYDLFQDKNQKVWVCQDNGISRIEYPSSLGFFDFTNGLNGVVNTVVEHENVLYAGTTNGLYFLDQEDHFQKMTVSGEVWDLKIIDEKILASATSGIYEVVGHKAKLINDLNARVIEPSGNKDMLFVGLSDGIGKLEKTKIGWHWLGKIDQVNHEVRTIAIESDSLVWGSFEEVSRIVFTSDLTTVISSETMGEEHGFLPEFEITESYTLRDHVYFGTGIGLFRFDEATDSFVHDNVFGERFANGKREAWAFAEDAESNIWLTSNKIVGKLSFENDQVQSWDTIAFARLKSTDVWRIVPIRERHIIYFCTTDGLFQFDQNIKSDYEIANVTLINKVEIDRDSVISYLGNETSQHNKNKSIAYSYNNLRFSFTATSYNYGEKMQFSYLLEGYDDIWSDWATESFKDYTNLPQGKYIFKVKAKNLYGVEAKSASYGFEIQPPWFRTYWAYTIAGILFIGVVFGIDRIQRKRLFKKQQARIKIQQQKLERERQISNKLRKVDKLKDEFLANTSHELRTPLNGIIGISESLYEESQHISEQEIKNNLAMVIASGKRLASMVDSILDYSKIKTENLDIRKKPVDLKSIVSVVLTMSRPIISQSNLTLFNEVPDDLPLLEADENRLQQILYNLVGNAIKFTPKGNIIVSAKLTGDFVEIVVKDDGIGIPEDKLDKIFDSYEQLDAEINREYIGTGLGLTISKKLVELHNGTIRVESKIKEGSSFIFTIPISMQESSAWIQSEIVQMDETEVTISNVSKENAQYHVLIVDDEPINRQVLANHLKHESYFLEMATNGFEALEKVRNKKFDIILLDVMMPKMSGFEVCMKIREKYMLSELPVIFITAKDQVFDLVEGLKYGGNDYITKPFSKQEFLARIKTQLNLVKINDSYARFIPVEFLQSLGRESIMDVNLGDQIEKNVTILFSDIRDYTTLSEGMTPKENFEFLNSFLNKMGPVIRDNNGFVMQYLGDGLMSIFLHDPMDAVKASITMVAQIEEYNISRENKIRKPIMVGMGLHTGKLVMGVIGDEKRMDVNVVSDSVNTASRMEGLTKHYGTSIIMSEHTLEGLDKKNNIHYRFLGLVRVKGKTKPLKIFEILDGISNEQNKIKIATKSIFEEGLEHYFNKEFIHAATEFKKVTNQNENDVTAQLYLKLSAKFMVEGVPENWTGVETMMLK